MNGWIVDLDEVDDSGARACPLCGGGPRHDECRLCAEAEPWPSAAVVILQYIVKLSDESHRLWRIVPNASGSWDYVKVTDDDR